MPLPIETRLAALCSPAIVPGLARTRSLLRLLGHPERGIPVNVRRRGADRRGPWRPGPRPER